MRCRFAARKERRTSHRYTPVREDVCLGWWEGRQFSTVPARLRSLSTSGALVDVENGRPAAKRVWICVSGQSPVQWVAANVLDDEEDTPEVGCLRLSFPETFPYEPFKAAVWGEQGGNCRSPPALTEPSPSKPYSPADQGAETGQAALSEEQRIQFFLGLADLPQVKAADSLGDPSRTPPFPQPPTLVQAHRADVLSRDRIALFPWMTVTAISLLIVFLLAIIVLARFEDIRWLGTIPILSN